MDLAGVWAWEHNLNPAGSDMTFALATDGDRVTGAGISHGIGPARVPDSLWVAGDQYGLRPNMSFRLTLTFASGRVVTYVGRLVGLTELDGTWTTSGQSNTVRFFRH